jgi:amidase
MKDDLANLDAIAQADLVRTGEASALELVDAAIARIEAVEPCVYALAAVDFEAARCRARSHPQGPLGGVPFLVKDLIAYPGLRHSMGSRLFAGNVSSTPTPYSVRLDDAGLIVIGKTTTSEFGLLGSTETLLEGVTRNPWDPTRSAGGSSGGSAAAVASRMVPFAHASDGGGSIRIPAAMNGLFGFMPGAGRLVSTSPGNMHGLLIDHCVSWSVRDSALLLSLTEQAAATVAPIGFVTGPSTRRLRIGVYAQTLMGDQPSGEIRSALESTASLCTELGHAVFETDSPPVDGAGLRDAFFAVAGGSLAQLFESMEPMLGRAVDGRDVEPFTLALVEWFKGLPPTALDDATATFERARGLMAAFFQRFDVTLCPKIPVALYELGTLAPVLERAELVRRTEQLAGYTPVHNMAGVPAMTVPLHVGSDGWPIGSHFAAARGHEATLLSLAYELEEAIPWHRRHASITASAERAPGVIA